MLGKDLYGSPGLELCRHCRRVVRACGAASTPRESQFKLRSIRFYDHGVTAPLILARVSLVRAAVPRCPPARDGAREVGAGRRRHDPVPETIAAISMAGAAGFVLLAVTARLSKA